MSFPDITPELKAAMPQLRGRLLANQSLAELTWFRVGGPAQVLFTPADESDLAYFLKHLPDDLPVYVVGVGSNLIVRDGGMSGVVIRLSPRAFGEASVDGEIVTAGAAALDKRVAETAAAANLAGLEFYLRHSRHHRRRAAHECRRQRRGDQGRAVRGHRHRPQGQRPHLLQRRHEIRLPQFRRRSLHHLHLGALSRRRPRRRRSARA